MRDSMNLAGAMSLTSLSIDPIWTIRDAANDSVLDAWRSQSIGTPRTGFRAVPIEEQGALLVDAADEVLRRAVQYQPVRAGKSGAIGPTDRSYFGWIPEGHVAVSFDEECFGAACRVLSRAILAGSDPDRVSRWSSVLRDAMLGMVTAQIGSSSESGILGLWTQSPRRENTCPSAALVNPGAICLNDGASSGNVKGLLAGGIALRDTFAPSGWLHWSITRAADAVIAISANNHGYMPEECDLGGSPVRGRIHEVAAWSARALQYSIEILLAAHAVSGAGKYLAEAERMAAVLDSMMLPDGTWWHRQVLSSRLTRRFFVSFNEAEMVPVFAVKGDEWSVTTNPDLGVSYTAAAASVRTKNFAMARTILDRYKSAA